MKTYAEWSEAKNFWSLKNKHTFYFNNHSQIFSLCLNFSLCHKKIFSLCLKIFPCVKAKFPVFSLSGKIKNQIPCFPWAVATLQDHRQSALKCNLSVRVLCINTIFLFLPPANEVWGKVMFLHRSVSQSVHRPDSFPPGRYPPPLRWQLKRAVRILLECIIVGFFWTALVGFWNNLVVLRLPKV